MIGDDIREHDLVIFDLSELRHIDDSSAHLFPSSSTGPGSHEPRSFLWASRRRFATFSTLSTYSAMFRRTNRQQPRRSPGFGGRDTELTGPFQKGGVLKQRFRKSARSGTGGSNNLSTMQAAAQATADRYSSKPRGPACGRPGCEKHGFIKGHAAHHFPP